MFNLLKFEHKSVVNLPFASIYFSSIANKLAKVNDAWIYNVSPVYLHPDMDQLILAEDLSEKMSVDTSKTICDSINNLFNESDYDKSWELIYCDRHHWFLISKKQLINQLPPTNQLGKPLKKTIRKNSFTDYWTQTLNEIQMFLFSMDFNKNAQSQSKTICNSLWIWGESYLNSNKTPVNKLWNYVYSNNLTINALSLYTKSPYAKLAKFDVMLKQSMTENVLIELSELESAIKNADIVEIVDVLLDYENKLFQPLYQSMLADSALSVKILTNGEKSYFINQRRLKIWWKRTQKSGSLFELIS